MSTQGINEIPMDLEDNLRRVLTQMRSQLIALRAAQGPLPSPTNFAGTALAFGSLLEWTRVTGADFYEILWNSTASAKTATVQGVGDSQRWVDNVGQSGITRFYWVRARRYTGGVSNLAGPVSVTTMAANAGVAPHTPPPPGHIQVIDQSSGHVVYYIPLTGRSEGL